MTFKPASTAKNITFWVLNGAERIHRTCLTSSKTEEVTRQLHHRGRAEERGVKISHNSNRWNLRHVVISPTHRFALIIQAQVKSSHKTATPSLTLYGKRVKHIFCSVWRQVTWRARDYEGEEVNVVVNPHFIHESDSFWCVSSLSRHQRLRLSDSPTLHFQAMVVGHVHRVVSRSRTASLQNPHTTWLKEPKMSVERLICLCHR